MSIQQCHAPMRTPASQADPMHESAGAEVGKLVNSALLSLMRRVLRAILLSTELVGPACVQATPEPHVGLMGRDLGRKGY